MKGYWTQPSLSRDFALLAAAVVFLLFLISSWVTYTTFNAYSQRIASDLAEEAERIEHTLAIEMEGSNYMLTALGRQIVLDNERNLVKLAQVLKSFDNKGYIYSIFSWISSGQRVVVSSNRGVLEHPVDVSDRDYVQQSQADPWKMNIGRPIEGRVSERWVIPVSMGLTDYTGKFIGTIMISMDIDALTDRLQKLLKSNGTSFAIVSKTLIPLTQVSDDKNFVSRTFPIQKLGGVNFSDTTSGLIVEGSRLFGAGSYFYYQVMQDYPYVILLGYDAQYSDSTVRNILWARLLQLLAIAVFFILFLWIMRTRMIRPVLEMTEAAAAVARGDTYTQKILRGPVEIRALSAQIYRIGEYIDENKRIEDELRNKVFMLKRAKEQAETGQRSKSEFLAYACQEMRNSINHTISLAQAMRDQLHGPMENRKYRQHATEIYQTGNSLLQYTQDLLAFSKMESGYIKLTEKPLVIADIVNKALRFMADKMQAEKRHIKVVIQEPLPKLMADEFRLQQMLVHSVLYIFEHITPDRTVTLEAKIINENKDKHFFVILVNSREEGPPASEDLTAWIDRLMDSADFPSPSGQQGEEAPQKQADLHFELIKSLISLHQGYCGVKKDAPDDVIVALFFPANRIHVGERDNKK